MNKKKGTTTQTKRISRSTNGLKGSGNQIVNKGSTEEANLRNWVNEPAGQQFYMAKCSIQKFQIRFECIEPDSVAMLKMWKYT